MKLGIAYWERSRKKWVRHWRRPIIWDYCYQALMSNLPLIPYPVCCSIKSCGPLPFNPFSGSFPVPGAVFHACVLSGSRMLVRLPVRCRFLEGVSPQGSSVLSLGILRSCRLTSLVSLDSQTCPSNVGHLLGPTGSPSLYSVLEHSRLYLGRS